MKKVERPRRGRPPGAADRVRPHRVVTFVSSKELKVLRELGDANGKSMSLTLHDILAYSFGHLDVVSPPVVKPTPTGPESE